jgi:predicted RNA binding protein YcfA (HicA-like mRNA interferase family)
MSVMSNMTSRKVEASSTPRGSLRADGMKLLRRKGQHLNREMQCA